MPSESGILAKEYVTVLNTHRDSRGVPHQQGGPARHVSTNELAVPCPAPKSDRRSAQWRPPSGAATSRQRVEPQEGRQTVREQPVAPHQSLQEEGSGYMSTESDSDTGTNDKVQRQPESPGSQPIRDYKGQSRQMITMAFLEEGGYFDVPIQVASARLGLGVTTLKRVCRASNMKRWPFRKRNSLGRLIDRTKQVLDDGTGQDNMQKLAALQVLEKQRQVMRSCQSKDMDEKIKSYRQAIFKLDHAERKRAEAPANPLMAKLTVTSAVQRILPGQEGFQAEAQSSISADN